eukprot:7361070-Prymnesium_polylepis.1
MSKKGVIGTEPSLECVTPGMARNPPAKKETKRKTSHARLARPYQATQATQAMQSHTQSEAA